MKLGDCHSNHRPLLTSSHAHRARATAAAPSAAAVRAASTAMWLRTRQMTAPFRRRAWTAMATASSARRCVRTATSCRLTSQRRCQGRMQGTDVRDGCDGDIVWWLAGIIPSRQKNKLSLSRSLSLSHTLSLSLSFSHPLPVVPERAYGARFLTLTSRPSSAGDGCAWPCW